MPLWFPEITANACPSDDSRKWHGYHARSDMGTAPENVTAEVEGDDLAIAFNPRYLIEALRSIEEETVKMIFMASLSPCTILPEEGDSFKYLILPLRM